MKQILLVGAGKSSEALIDLFIKDDRFSEITLTVIDRQPFSFLSESINFYQRDITDSKIIEEFVLKSILVVSLLPAALHYNVASVCVKYGVDFLSASYPDDKMLSLDEKAKAAGVLLMMECGLDPGIDHLIAKEMIDEVCDDAGEIKSFKSFTGGVSKNIGAENPWGYKLTWNLNNVVNAGNKDCNYILNGQLREVLAEEVFRTRNKVKIEGLHELECYPNRKAQRYLSIYGLDNADLFRGTLRYKGFIEAWSALKDIGWFSNDGIDSNQSLLQLSALLHKPSLPPNKEGLVLSLSARYESHILEKLEWLGLFSDEYVEGATFLEVLTNVLVRKFTRDQENDLVVMQNEIEYFVDGILNKTTKTLIFEGQGKKTAMSFSVGAMLLESIALILSSNFSKVGIQVPVGYEFYYPLLKSLYKHGLIFKTRRLNK